MATSEPTIRPTVPEDLHAIGEIYAHHVQAASRLRDDPRDQREWSRRFRADADASVALHRNRGFKHGRWLDTLLLQRSLTGVGR